MYFNTLFLLKSKNDRRTKERVVKDNRKDHMKNKDLEPRVIEKHEGNKLRNYWKKAMRSVHNKLSRGAEAICKVITSAHKDNWRRGREKKK